MDLHADHERGMVDVDAASRHAAAAGLTVDAENVLYVRKAILDEYQTLLGCLVGESNDLAAWSRPYGDDPVSADAAAAFPERAGVLISQCKEQVVNLLSISDKLKEAALSFGYTEEQIASNVPVRADAAIAAASRTIHAILNPWERG